MQQGLCGRGVMKCRTITLWIYGAAVTISADSSRFEIKRMTILIDHPASGPDTPIGIATRDSSYITQKGILILLKN